MKTLQKFASVHANVHNHFDQGRHLVDRQTSKGRRSVALAEWQSLMALVRARKAKAALIGNELRLD